MKRPISHRIKEANADPAFTTFDNLVNSPENKRFSMRIHHILLVFILVSTISCQSSQTEVKDVSFDTSKDLTDHKEISTSDTVPVIGNEQVPEGPDSNFIKRKADEGIDFFATGTEPFWSIDMDFEKQFSFRTMDGFILNTPPSEALKNKNPNVSRYSARVEAGEIMITILKKECINAMSGAKSPYEVSIRVKSSNEKDFTDYKGCGQYTDAH
jgi:uncharacterized membrane protein